MNPTEQFREAVESALCDFGVATAKTVAEGPPIPPDAATRNLEPALASIQASTLQFFTALIGEDDDVTDLKNFNSKAEHRNTLRQELRQKIDQLIKDLSK